MIFWPILGLFVIAAGYVIRNNFDFPDNKNLDGVVNMVGWGVKVAGLLLFIISTFNGMFFYAEPGFKYHVRTILGEEKMVSDKAIICICLAATMHGKTQFPCKR